MRSTASLGQLQDVDDVLRLFDWAWIDPDGEILEHLRVDRLEILGVNSDIGQAVWKPEAFHQLFQHVARRRSGPGRVPRC